MEYLPFSLDPDDSSYVTELDVLLQVKINSIDMMLYQGYRISEFERFLVDPTIDSKVKEEKFIEYYTLKAQETEEVTNANRSKLIQLALQEVYHKSIPDPDDPGITLDRTAMVFFAVTIKSGKQTSKTLLQRFIKEMGDNNYNVGIMITEKPLNVSTKDDIDKMTKDTLAMSKQSSRVSAEEQAKLQELVRRGTIFYHFSHEQLLYNVTKHYLTSKHTILNSDERLTLINSGVDLEDLTIISFTDPMVRYIGAIPGDVVKITGDNLIQTGSRTYVNYKMVRDIP